MKNTNKEIMGTECMPTVLPEFAELLPPLSAEQLAVLEADILKNGCYAPIIVNEDMVVIDGHNRLSICDKHGLPYRMAVFSFEDDLEAKQWALDTQKSRRNLDKWELGQIALKLKPEIEAKAKANMGHRNDLCMKSDEGFAPVDTRQALADSVGLSRDTMSKVMRIDECAPAPIKEALDSSVISINRGYDITRELSELPEDEREQAALEAVIKEMNRKEERKLKEADDRYRVAKAYNAGFEHAALMRISDENISTWVEQSGITYRQLDHLIREARAISKNFMRIADFLENTVKAKHWRNAANG